MKESEMGERLTILVAPDELMHGSLASVNWWRTSPLTRRRADRLAKQRGVSPELGRDWIENAAHYICFGLQRTKASVDYQPELRCALNNALERAASGRLWPGPAGLEMLFIDPIRPDKPSASMRELARKVRYGDNPVTVDELVVAAFPKVHAAINAGLDITNPRGWMRKVLTTTLQDLTKRYHRQRLLEAGPLENTVGYDERVPLDHASDTTEAPRGTPTTLMCPIHLDRKGGCDPSGALGVGATVTAVLDGMTSAAAHITVKELLSVVRDTARWGRALTDKQIERLLPCVLSHLDQRIETTELGGALDSLQVVVVQAELARVAMLADTARRDASRSRGSARTAEVAESWRDRLACRLGVQPDAVAAAWDQERARRST